MAAAWRHVREAITLLAATADDLQAAMTRIRLLSYTILDGNLIPGPRGRAYAIGARPHRWWAADV